ncbi:hypothetical protein KGP36_05965 [Patescibacteria group bacterium]|nr:hypothetical protein [Patescibacteria group bacterium]
MNYERQAQEAADLTRLPHFVITFASGYRTLTTQPDAWINLGGKVKSIEQYRPTPSPKIQWLTVMAWSLGALWCVLVWAAVFYTLFRIF